MIVIKERPVRCYCCGARFDEYSIIWPVIAGKGTPGYLCTKCHDDFFKKKEVKK